MKILIPKVTINSNEKNKFSLILVITLFCLLPVSSGNCNRSNTYPFEMLDAFVDRNFR